jgi:hypothetical protein
MNANIVFLVGNVGCFVNVIKGTFQVAKTDPERVSANSFLEVLINYSNYDRIYFDSSLLFANRIEPNTKTSVFFKQHLGQISTRFVILKADQNLAKSIAILGERAKNLFEDLTFTYLISNNYLISKALSDKQIISGKLLNTANVSTINTSQVIAVDMTGVSGKNVQR